MKTLTRYARYEYKNKKLEIIVKDDKNQDKTVFSLPATLIQSTTGTRLIINRPEIGPDNGTLYDIAIEPLERGEGEVKPIGIPGCDALAEATDYMAL